MWKYIYNKRCEILFETCDGKMTGLNLLRVTYRLFIIEIFLPLCREKGGGGKFIYLIGFCLFIRWLSRIEFIGLNLIFEREEFFFHRHSYRIEVSVVVFPDLTVAKKFLREFQNFIYNHYCYPVSR